MQGFKLIGKALGCTPIEADGWPMSFRLIGAGIACMGIISATLLARTDLLSQTQHGCFGGTPFCHTARALQEYTLLFGTVPVSLAFLCGFVTAFSLLAFPLTILHSLKRALQEHHAQDKRFFMHAGECGEEVHGGGLGQSQSDFKTGNMAGMLGCPADDMIGKSGSRSPLRSRRAIRLIYERKLMDYTEIDCVTRHILLFVSTCLAVMSVYLYLVTLLVLGTAPKVLAFCIFSGVALFTLCLSGDAVPNRATALRVLVFAGVFWCAFLFCSLLHADTYASLEGVDGGADRGGEIEALLPALGPRPTPSVIVPMQQIPHQQKHRTAHSSSTNSNLRQFVQRPTRLPDIRRHDNPDTPSPHQQHPEPRAPTVPLIASVSHPSTPTTHPSVLPSPSVQLNERNSTMVTPDRAPMPKEPPPSKTHTNVPPQAETHRRSPFSALITRKDKDSGPSPLSAAQQKKSTPVKNSTLSEEHKAAKETNTEKGNNVQKISPKQVNEVDPPPPTGQTQKIDAGGGQFKAPVPSVHLSRSPADPHHPGEMRLQSVTTTEKADKDNLLSFATPNPHDHLFPSAPPPPLLSSLNQHQPESEKGSPQPSSSLPSPSPSPSPSPPSSTTPGGSLEKENHRKERGKGREQS
uniref:Uncharacterized protein n=1 Tax=Chromera velia CCMP2878 TaxID=1169474 RepID=A0A0G4FA97_9ALVE|eukprot:Cvel_3020.t1-p1 / transcript=Cvel_3020.t1 / gene=Cvel_3020 / organism=Chromera_velia_CCMP2878 / gene_product=hypothetical protein / transcript_product=hypothetical protein / location=Cvel_scaffold120:122112-124125(+) / protein_length=633 / sequence_SO=supercontig / SO=protein_coding / is_pseudo=false